jgi:hypothetical protein
VLLGLLLRHATIDVKRWFVNNRRMVLPRDRLLCWSLLLGLHPHSQIDWLDRQTLHHINEIHMPL